MLLRVCVLTLVTVILPQRGFFSLPEGHYFIEPVQKTPDDPAGTPEPHAVYPRVTTESPRNKRDVESGETPRPCGVQGVHVYGAADVLYTQVFLRVKPG